MQWLSLLGRQLPSRMIHRATLTSGDFVVKSSFNEFDASEDDQQKETRPFRGSYGDMNQVILRGRISMQPIVVDTARGKMAMITIATNEPNRDTASFVTVRSLLERTVRAVEEGRLSKSQSVQVQGRLNNSRDADGKTHLWLLADMISEMKRIS